MKILFTGGGTGGHIYPIVSVAEVLLQTSSEPVDLYYVGVPGVYEQQLTSRGMTVFRVASAKLRSGELLRNLLDVPFFFIGLLQALWRVFLIMPDILFSKGGPGALPVVLACAFYRIPIIVHESDSVAGFTNRVSGKYADAIGIAFATAKESFIKEGMPEYKRAAIEHKLALVGNPIRDIFFMPGDTAAKTDAKRLLDFDPAKPLIVVIGGSQGSVRVNDFFMSIAEELLNRNIQVLHQAGLNNAATTQADLAGIMQKYSDTFRRAYRIVPYFGQEIKDALLAADIVVSRAGSGAIFEIAAMGCPAILVPLPESARDHQVKNAFEYASTGAAITVEEANLTKHTFLTQVDKLLADSALLASMASAAKAFAKPDAADVLVQEILRLSKK
ncbi:hypothetical protein A2524_02000 [Candidatus Wolfebacteria bacterium RIFOXYD12_FULL_48_21]|uniref:UDP-N-acetylglucosamine--N-acetylmuramyl-(pentapeptide) pyrophosphoryl-undecaprenol N-acetylglucosamine transferase n=1 Tax=Candidatus Wolfebacteria bacterium RIFOXYD1_FULL_48_65 TaxID=1802561 RepID=A0A1F8DZQ0_9BACT|nr:MAG: hypothetical protein A2610_03970 [Candidatus Wolfebacteria bacterium RIFOXYD1_FULL_48_65]OGM94568.1 MAG: hypothetical protein A2524_02000 [Candidatus Wolfebacteria bacterium RIFOXYD12_FULL_48_21]OGM96545.1 MAG: hypothetical protein A2532_02415 [Candidatus Wolfebacteria bacterium RIFOXYD2_FULL_48_11]